MELKFETGESVRIKLYRSNRTFMELKSCDDNWFLMDTCSNRTFMELKFQSSNLLALSLLSSNRTFMELK